MSTITVLDSGGVARTVTLPNGNGRAVAAASAPVAISNEDLAALAIMASADNFAAVTPSDSVDLATTPKGLFIGGAGNLTVKGADGVSATFVVAAGLVLPIRPRRVMTTGTTATSIVALS